MASAARLVPATISKLIDGQVWSWPMTDITMLIISCRREFSRLPVAFRWLAIFPKVPSSRHPRGFLTVSKD